MLRRVLFVVVVIALCSGVALASEAVEFERGTVVIDKGRKTATLRVEIAQTSEQRSFGLMHRESLARNAGMVFLFPETSRGGFWMKNTLIPLSIAFYDSGGKILRIMLMDPCTEDPCRTYDPGVGYRGALEVNRGTFGRLGVSRGDIIRLRR